MASPNCLDIARRSTSMGCRTIYWRRPSATNAVWVPKSQTCQFRVEVRILTAAKRYERSTVTEALSKLCSWCKERFRDGLGMHCLRSDWCGKAGMGCWVPFNWKQLPPMVSHNWNGNLELQCWLPYTPYNSSRQNKYNSSLIITKQNPAWLEKNYSLNIFFKIVYLPAVCGWRPSARVRGGYLRYEMVWISRLWWDWWVPLHWGFLWTILGVW